MDYTTECYLVNREASLDKDIRIALADRFVILADIGQSVVFMKPGKWIARWCVYEDRLCRIDQVKSTDAVWVGRNPWNRDCLFKARLEITDPPRDETMNFVVECANLSSLSLREHRPIEIWRTAVRCTSEVGNIIRNHDQLQQYL